MTMHGKSEFDDEVLRQLESLCHRIQLGIAGDDEAARFAELLDQHEDARPLACVLLMDEALLRTELRIMRSKKQFDEIVPCLPGMMEATSRETPTLEEPEKGTALAIGTDNRGTTIVRSDLRRRLVSRDASRTWHYTSFLAGAVLAILASQLVWHLFPADDQSTPNLAALPSESSSVTRVAQVVRTSGILWSNHEGRRITPGSALVAGDTIRLSSGIGLLDFGSGYTLYMEGPAEVEISLDGGVAIRHGRVCVRVSSEESGQLIQTSLSTLQLTPSALVGVSSSGSELEVHSFAGSVEVFPDPIFSCPDTFEVDAGNALRFDVSHAGSLRTWKCDLGREKFASLAQADKEQLDISPEYVESVLQANPIMFWRFEDIVDGLGIDEVSGLRNCQLFGEAKSAAQRSTATEGALNHVLDIGYGSAHGSVVSTGKLAQLKGESYTVELWVKPTHYHHGVLMALFDTTAQHGVILHGMMLELRDDSYSPRSIRFLHRTPAGASGGTDCFSQEKYNSGRWQHVAAVKDGSEMRLYIDGTLVSVGKNSTSVDSQLSVILGQLYPDDPVRPFVGQLDELAVYDYALSGEEISHHYGLSRK